MPSDATPRTANEALAVAMLAPLGIDVALVPVETEMARQVLAALIASGWQIVRTVAAAPDPENARLWAERNHYLAGCVCPTSPWCAPHGWAGTVEPDDHSICADHPHVDPRARADIPDTLKRLEHAPDPVATGEPMPMRMRTALSAFEAWAEAVIPMLENAGDTETAAYGRDRIEQSENARTTVRRWSAPAPVASPPEAVRLLRAVVSAIEANGIADSDDAALIDKARRYLAATEEGS